MQWRKKTLAPTTIASHLFASLRVTGLLSSGKRCPLTSGNWLRSGWRLLFPTISNMISDPKLFNWHVWIISRCNTNYAVSFGLISLTAYPWNFLEPPTFCAAPATTEAQERWSCHCTAQCGVREAQRRLNRNAAASGDTSVERTGNWCGDDWWMIAAKPTSTKIKPTNSCIRTSLRLWHPRSPRCKWKPPGWLCNSDSGIDGSSNCWSHVKSKSGFPGVTRDILWCYMVSLVSWRATRSISHEQLWVKHCPN